MSVQLKKLVQIPIFEQLKTLLVMNCVFFEFAGGFVDDGCDIHIVRNFNDLQDGGIILLDDAAGKYIENQQLYEDIATKCPNSIFICWYWMNCEYKPPFKNIIFTGEYYLNNNCTDEKKRNYFSLPNYVPLRLRANDPPRLIGSYPRNVVRDYCFMGGGYKRNWVPDNSTGLTGIYHQVFTNEYLSYNKRREIYLSSMFAFGFQSDENIINGHLSQRIFEGLAYGCIVLCENPLASTFTDGAVIYVSSKEHLLQTMLYYKKNPELVRKKQEQGYEWVRKYGTNRYSATFFLEKIKELYNIGFI